MLMTTGTLGLIFVGIGHDRRHSPRRSPCCSRPSAGQQAGIALAALLLLAGGMALRYAILVGGQIVQTFYF
ncbi:MAG: hypothetical protein MZW92_46655 [Comamonadaceae bacterium]|nr:hypothetical protein [Comamonadaceae bacterium]